MFSRQKKKKKNLVRRMRNRIRIVGAGLLFAQANLAMFEPDRRVGFSPLPSASAVI